MEEMLILWLQDFIYKNIPIITATIQEHVFWQTLKFLQLSRA